MKFDSTPFIVDRNTKIVFDRCKYVARSFFFFESIDRWKGKHAKNVAEVGRWVSSRIVSSNNCPVISETASTGGCTIIERRNVNDLHWQGYMKPPLSHAARIVFVLSGNWALLGEIGNQSFLSDIQWTRIDNSGENVPRESEIRLGELRNRKN